MKKKKEKYVEWRKRNESIEKGEKLKKKKFTWRGINGMKMMRWKGKKDLDWRRWMNKKDKKNLEE